MEATYKKIPKKLRKNFNKEQERTFWMIVKAFVIFPYLYSQRHKLFAMGLVKDNLHLPLNHLYWLANNSEHINGDPSRPLDFKNCWYGDPTNRWHFFMKLGWIGRYIASMNWMIFRNGAWNYILKVGLKFKAGFKVIKVLDKEGLAKSTTFRNDKIKGIQSVILVLKGTHDLYFRYSYTLPLPKYSLWRLLGYKEKNVQRGVKSNGWVLKKRKF